MEAAGTANAQRAVVIKCTNCSPANHNRCLNQIAHNTSTNGRQNPQLSGTSTTSSSTRNAQTMGEKNCSPSPRNFDASVQLCNATSSASSNVTANCYTEALRYYNNKLLISHHTKFGPHRIMIVAVHSEHTSSET